jgi:hypothetical protein
MTIQTDTDEYLRHNSAATIRTCCGRRCDGWAVSARGCAEGGWRILDATPSERVLLEEHGFGSARVQ